MSDARTAAIQILENMKRLGGSCTFVDAHEAEFSHLELEHYRKFKQKLEKSGYRFIGDIEILEVSNAPGSILARTMLRIMLSADGLTSVAYYQIKPRIARVTARLIQGLFKLRFIAAPRFFFPALKTKHCFDIESEYENLHFVRTSNTHGASLIQAPRQINSKFFPYGTQLKALIADHSARCRGAQLTHRPIRMENKDDVLAMQARMQSVKSSYREAIRWVSNDETLKSSDGNTEQADAIFAEITKLRKQEEHRMKH